MTNPLVSILVVTWNRKKDILETVQSIYEQTYKNFEIIVVDNGSEDGTKDAISSFHPEIVLVALDQNKGVTAGRNVGIRIARGEIILCLDSDASVGRDTIQNIVQKFEEDQGVGVINSKILNAYTHKFDSVAGWAYNEKTKAKSEQEFYSHNFSETGCAIRKQVFEKAGLFWERLFFGREGEEFSLRVLDAGYKILYYPSAVVYHRVSPNKRIEGSDRQYYDLKNSLSIYIARYPWWLLLYFVPMKITASLIRGLRRGNITWLVRAVIEVISELSSLWEERCPIENNTARIYLDFQLRLGTLGWNPILWLKYKK